jgi:hypothetical protein
LIDFEKATSNSKQFIATTSGFSSNLQNQKASIEASILDNPKASIEASILDNPKATIEASILDNLMGRD